MTVDSSAWADEKETAASRAHCTISVRVMGGPSKQPSHGFTEKFLVHECVITTRPRRIAANVAKLPGLVLCEDLGGGPPSRLFFIIEITRLLAVRVQHDETRTDVFD
jgi:hypothetical protein